MIHILFSITAFILFIFEYQLDGISLLFDHVGEFMTRTSA